MTRHDLSAGPVDRRTALAGAGVTAAALTLAAACSSNDSSAPAASSATVAPAASGAPAAPSGALVSTAQVPVGGGVIVGDTVVTQPTAGTFEGFSTTCTHAGCKVNQVVNGLIQCPCHGSEFHLDGSVARGPASRPLDAHPVKVSGDSVIRA
ncbi:Rieske Fe-S protein [Nocardia sp. GAS34]|uniref:QcrA and Rieske domain-containing protein n=1 Tax=unclassified Nocardia TaxID=2637762 RepID=UPI003D1DEF42